MYTFFAFAMIAAAGSIYDKLKGRGSYIGVQSFFMFPFTFLRIGHALDFLSAMRHPVRRHEMSLWNALDLLVIVAAIAHNMVCAWRQHGGALAEANEEAFAVFWLWIFFILTATVVTPSRGSTKTRTRTGETRADKSKRKAPLPRSNEQD